MPLAPGPGQPRAIVLALAVFAAPFLALLYSPVAGLAVMAASLVTAAFLLRGVQTVVVSARARWVQLATAIDLGLALACIVALLWLVVGG